MDPLFGFFLLYLLYCFQVCSLFRLVGQVTVEFTEEFSSQFFVCWLGFFEFGLCFSEFFVAFLFSRRVVAAFIVFTLCTNIHCTTWPGTFLKQS